MKDFLSRLVSQIKYFLGSGRNYGCLPEDIETRHPAQRPEEPASNRPEPANSVEKGDSLR
jgi:hypothetical protein